MKATVAVAVVAVAVALLFLLFLLLLSERTSGVSLGLFDSSHNFEPSKNLGVCLMFLLFQLCFCGSRLKGNGETIGLWELLLVTTYPGVPVLVMVICYSLIFHQVTMLNWKLVQKFSEKSLEDMCK